MKSTIKQTYQKKQNSDESVDLIVKSRSLTQQQRAMFGCLILVFTFLAAFFAGAIFRSWTPALFVIGTGFYFLYKLVALKEHTIKLQKAGIILDNGRKQIALTDISSIGVMDTILVMRNSTEEQSHVYVDALGSRVKITGDMSNATADAIRKEITGFYGCFS